MRDETAGPAGEPPTAMPESVVDPAEVLRSLTEGSQTTIGRFRLLEKIGEGGFGVVYVAEQKSPIKRRVALKIIKLGMDTRAVVARFEAERQALAMMDHPNIAKVFDAGTTDTGRPYFAMELVRGIKITDYCDQNKVPTRKRLELFIQVCQAIQHAHQKGIIHRDIKPSNILLTLHDGTPVPKVIDFGIAKATQGELTDKTIYTQFQQFVGTPAYMSPEQAEMSGLDIDTRSDIYSMGVLLYELLTGRTPFDGTELVSMGIDAMRKAIREKEPVKPSTKVATLAREELSTTAARHSSDAPKLIHLLRGDLDWIVMKCLEKDRTRRYESASGLAVDIQRHLNNEPVAARPPSRWYRFQKSFRRNKAAYVAGSAVAGALLLGIVASTWQAVRATHAQREAVIEKQLADHEAAAANRVTSFMQQMLATANPASSKSPDYTVREMLDDFAKAIDTQFADDPEVAAELHTTIGEAYWNMQENSKAKAQLARALELRARVYGTDNASYADALVNYAETPSVNANPAELQECAAYLRKALAIYQERGIKGQQVIHALWALQMICDRAQKYDQIEQLVTEAKAQAAQTPGASYWELTAMNNGLINAKVQQGKYAEAEKIAYETIASNNRQFGPDYIQSAWAYYHLAGALLHQSKYAEALDAAKQAVAIMRKRISPDQEWYGYMIGRVLDTLTQARSARVLTSLFSSPGQLEKLEPLFQERLGSKPLLPNDDADPVNVSKRAVSQFPGLYLELANEMSAAGRTNEAAECRRKAAASLEQLETLNSSNPDLLAEVYLSCIQSSVRQGDLAKAKAYRQKLFTLQHLGASSLNEVAWTLATSPYLEMRDGANAIFFAEKAVAATNRKNASILDTLAAAYAQTGQFDQAVATEKEAIKLLPAKNTDQSYAECLSLYESSIPYRDTDALADEVEALLHAGKFAQVEPEARICLTLRQKLTPDDWRTFNAQSMLGGSLLGQKKYTDAGPLLLTGYEGLKQRQDKIPAGDRQPRLKEALGRLMQFDQATGQTQKAAALQPRLDKLNQPASP